MDNRTKIIASALKLFSIYGYDSVGVQRLAEEAGVTKPTLYHYFGSKSGLLQSLLDHYYTTLLESLEQEADYQGDLPQTLTRTAEVYFAFADQNKVFYRMQLSMWFAPESSQAHQAVSEAALSQHLLLEKIFMLAVEQHGNMRGRHQIYAATFLGMINTYIGLILNDHAKMDDELIYRAVHQFMHGIYS